MSSSQPPLKDIDIVELLDRLQQDSTSQRADAISQLEPHVQDELNQALAAQALLAQIAPVQPPVTLPSQTARRTRRRLRSQSEARRSKIDIIVTIAVVALVLSVIFLITYQLREFHKRADVKVIKLQLTPED